VSRKRKVIGAVLAVAGLLIAGEILAGFLRLERQRAMIESRLTEAAGLDVSIGGGLELHLFPAPRFEANGVTVANIPNRPSPHLLAIDSVDLAFDSWSLVFGKVEIDRLKLVGVEAHVETNAQGDFPVDHHVDTVLDETAPDPVDLRIRRFEAEDVRVFFLDGESGALTTLRLSDFSLTAGDSDEPIALVARGEIDGAGFDLLGRGGPLPELLQPTAPYPISLAGRLLEAEIEADGTVAAPLDLAGFDVSFTAAAPGLAGLARASGEALPRIGPISISGHLTERYGVFGAHDLAATAGDGSAVRGEVTGAIANLAAFAGVELEARLVAESVSFLAPILGWPVPDDLSLSALATASDADGSLGIAGTANAATPDGRISLEASGAHGDLSRLDGLDVEVRLHARDLMVVGDAMALAAKLPPIGPVDARGRLRDRGGALALDDVAVQIGSHATARAEIRGSVADAAGFRGVGLHTTIHAADSRHLLAHLGREIPDLGPVHISAHVNDGDGSLGIEDVAVRAGHAGVFELELSGSFDHVREIDEIEFDARLAASDLAVVGSLLGAELPPIGPVAFAGGVAGSDEAIRSSGTLRLDETTFSGEWSGSFPPGDRPRLTARIESSHVHLDDVGIEPHPDAAESSREDSAPPARPPSGSEALPFDQLRAVDLDLTLHAERVTGRAGFELTDARTSISLTDGELTLRDFSADYETGSMKAFLRTDASTPVPSFAFRGDVRDVDLTRLMSQFQQDTEHAGHVDLAVAVVSRGHTLAEIRSHLEGRVEARLREGTLASRYGSKFVKEVALVSIPDFLPGRATAVDCLVAALAIDDGVARVETLRLDGPRAVITGAGRVDLARDAYYLRFTPRPRDPNLLSVAAQVDVKGPLANPTFSPVPRTLATSAARAIVSNALRPAGTLLRPLRGRNSGAPGDGCDWEPFAPDFP
jgi:uncharacterized protein involved in outer membrane biogenesis